MNVNEEDTYRQNPIFYSVSNGQLDACKLLHSLGSRHDYIDNNGETPLFYAIKSNRMEVTTWLLNLKCNLFVTNNKHQSLVQFAQKYNKHSIKEVLLRHGAPPPPNAKDAKRRAAEKGAAKGLAAGREEKIAQKAEEKLNSTG